MPIAYAGISGVWGWRQMQFRGTAHRRFIGVIIGYMLLSIPMHLVTWFTHSTAHLQVFPLWFSILLQPFYATVLVALWRLQFKS